MCVWVVACFLKFFLTPLAAFLGRLCSKNIKKHQKEAFILLAFEENSALSQNYNFFRVLAQIIIHIFLLTITSGKTKPIIPILRPFNSTVMEGSMKSLSSGRSLKSQLAQTIGNVTFRRKGSSPSIPSSNS